MEFEAVAGSVQGIPFMSPSLGRRLYDHIRATRPEQALELGTAHGVSAAYIAAALEANGSGHLITVDHRGAAYDPAPEDVMRNAGLDHRGTIFRDHSSYNWFLKQQIEQASDDAGNCCPRFDFCYLDGSKNWNLDGLAVVLIEKLLRSDGWLLMDDLEWTYDSNPWIIPAATDQRAARAGGLRSARTPRGAMSWRAVGRWAPWSPRSCAGYAGAASAPDPCVDRALGLRRHYGSSNSAPGVAGSPYPPGRPPPA